MAENYFGKKMEADEQLVEEVLSVAEKAAKTTPQNVQVTRMGGKVLVMMPDPNYPGLVRATKQHAPGHCLIPEE